MKRTNSPSSPASTLSSNSRSSSSSSSPSSSSSANQHATHASTEQQHHSAQQSSHRSLQQQQQIPPAPLNPLKRPASPLAQQPPAKQAKNTERAITYEFIVASVRNMPDHPFYPFLFPPNAPTDILPRLVNTIHPQPSPPPQPIAPIASAVPSLQPLAPVASIRQSVAQPGASLATAPSNHPSLAAPRLPAQSVTAPSSQTGGGSRPASSVTAPSSQTGGGNRAVSFTRGSARRAFRGALLVERYVADQHVDDINVFLDSFRQSIRENLEALLAEHHGLKLWLGLDLQYYHLVDERYVEDHIISTSQVLLNEFQIDEVLELIAQELRMRSANFLRNGSPFVLDSVESAVLHIARYSPIRGGTYQELPKFLVRKKCIVNVKNDDNRCFGFSLLAFLVPQATNRFRAEPLREFFDQYGLDDITYPVAPNQVPELEDRLHLNISIFSFFDDVGKARFPMYVSRKNFEKSVDLLYWNGHYALITSFERFLADITKSKVQKVFCRHCFGHFKGAEALQRHQLFCNRPNFSSTIYTLPPPDTSIEFRNVRYQQRVPFVVYADCEAICAPNKEKHRRSLFYSHHLPCSIGYKLVTEVPQLVDEAYHSYTGPDVVKWFMGQMRELETRCMTYLFDNKRLRMTEGNWQAYNHAQVCYICFKPFNGDKVRDHDHLTGRYRGAAHNICNLVLRKTYKIPVFFHNFRGYDSHLVVWGLADHPDLDISLIGQGMEKYLTLGWGEHLVFKDSLQFLASSLETLAANLLRSGEDRFKQLARAFTENNQPHPNFNLLLRKGVFPYEFLDSWEKMDEQQLPPRDAFFSRLNNEECKEPDYAHAMQVWGAFDCKSLRSYMELYLKTDVLLLADIFEEFRDVCIRNYGLDPAHYVSAPQLSWDSMLRITDCSLELISDPEMFSCVDAGIRGGVSMITTRLARANNPYMASFNPSEPTSFIIYLDANNLYGWAMSQPMPTGGFMWMTGEEAELVDWAAQTEEQTEGFFVEVDLEYPPEVHNAHNDYPLAPERLDVKVEMLSEAQVELRTHYKMPRSAKSTKLIPNLMAKRKYLCHYLNLRFYLEHGLKLVKVHRALRFKQSRWLSPYIEKNSTLRASAKNDFEKEFFKLMNNSIYGKTCENQKKRTDIRLVTTEKKCKKLVEKPHCLGFRIFEEHLVGIELRKQKVLIDKPFYVGFSVLELSKLHMYR